MRILKDLIELTKQALTDNASMRESQAWQQDYEQAEINQFAESCLPQKPPLNLNHINIEDWEDED